MTSKTALEFVVYETGKETDRSTWVSCYNPIQISAIKSEQKVPWIASKTFIAVCTRRIKLSRPSNYKTSYECQGTKRNKKVIITWSGKMVNIIISHFLSQHRIDRKQTNYQSGHNRSMTQVLLVHQIFCFRLRHPSRSRNRSTVELLASGHQLVDLSCFLLAAVVVVVAAAGVVVVVVAAAAVVVVVVVAAAAGVAVELLRQLVE